MQFTERQEKDLMGITAGIVVIIFLVQLFTLYVDLYSIITWFDNLMHFLGGVFLGYFIHSIFVKYFPHLVKRARTFIFLALFIAFGIGLVWEIYEVVVHTLTNSFMQDYVDTITDLVFDMLGAGLATFLVWKYNLKTELNNNL